MGQDMGDVTENKENEGDFMRILIAEAGKAEIQCGRLF